MFEQAVRYRAQSRPNAPAIETALGPISYAQFNRAIFQFADHLAECGVVPGQTILVADDRPFVHWCLVLAAESLGAVTLSGSTKILPEELGFSDLVIGADASGALNKPEIVTDDSWVAAALAREPMRRSAFAQQPTDPIRIVVTSGTTGRPKAILLTRAMVEARIAHLATSHIPSEPRMLSTMGINSIGGYLASRAVWVLGGTMIYTQGTNVAAAVTSLHPTFLLVAPVQLQNLLSTLPAEHQALEGLRVAVGGSAISRRLVAETERRLTRDILLAYGSTEAGPTTAVPSGQMSWESGLVGAVLPWSELEIVDDNDQVAPVGQLGKVRVRAEAMADRYIGNDDFDLSYKDGWFYPGDIGAMRADGAVLIAGRTDEVINLGGVKLSASALDETISEHDGVTDAAVFVQATSTDEFRLAAAVVVANERNFQSVVRGLASKLPVPVRCYQFSKIPRNHMGKTSRQQLADLVSDNAAVGAQ